MSNSIFGPPRDEMLWEVKHWMIEDGVSNNTHGVMIEFFPSSRGVGVTFKPFTRGPNWKTDGTKDFSLDEVNYLCVYSDTTQIAPLMEAMYSGDIRGNYAHSIMVQIIHELIPAEWAEKYLPNLYQRATRTGEWK